MNGNGEPKRKRALVKYYSSDDDDDFATSTGTQQATTSSRQPSTSSASSQRSRVNSQNQKKMTEAEACKPIPTKFDAGSRDQRPRILTPDVISEILTNRPVAIIVSPNAIVNYTPIGRLKVEKQLFARIPPGCHPANLAQSTGTVSTSNSVEYPGVPFKQFSQDDVPRFEDEPDMWNRQTVFEIPNDAENFNAKYVGFDSLCIWQEEIENLEDEDPLLSHRMNVRNEFLLRIEQTDVNQKLRRGLRRERYLEDGLIEDYKSLFWNYQDLSYFHSMEQRNNGLPAVFYMCLQDTIVEPPKFMYSTLNIMTNEVLNECLKMERPRRKKLANTKVWDKINTPCERPDACKCNQVFEAYYKTHPDYPRDQDWNRKNMVPDRDGLLDVANFDPSYDRIVVECSDACGCSINCPRRGLQRGQPSELVVYYENEVLGFGLRATKLIRQGELICEYVGQLLILGAESEVSTIAPHHNASYDCEVRVFNRDMVISSWKAGNLGRFAAHACDPNSTFLEVHSRRLESDPLIPRLAAYALRDIPAGGEVSIRYYAPSQMTKKAKGVPCQCKPGCPNIFPVIL